MAEASHAGIDVGGTKCLGVALDSRGEIVDEHRVATPSVADRLLDVLTELAERFAPIASLGVGVPGLVDRAGVLHAAPNLGAAAGLAVGPMLGERLGMAVRVD
ncbi:MAG: ROK family protein, partial [Ilumatobacteraceae bacterium]